MQDTWVGGWDECSTADSTTCQDDDQCVRVVQRYLNHFFYLVLTSHDTPPQYKVPHCDKSGKFIMSHFKPDN